MTEQETLALFKCLADRSRLQILKSLAQEEMYVERLAQRLGLSPGTVSFHLKKLAQAGAVTSHKSQYYTIYALNRPLFDQTILSLLAQQSEEEDQQLLREEQYRRQVLETFFDHGKLKSIPVQRKKERIVLEELAKHFQPGRLYPEREVNLILADFHDDFCTLRRDMISEKLMARDERGYWRTEQEPEAEAL